MNKYCQLLQWKILRNPFGLFKNGKYQIDLFPFFDVAEENHYNQMEYENKLKLHGFQDWIKSPKKLSEDEMLKSRLMEKFGAMIENKEIVDYKTEIKEIIKYAGGDSENLKYVLAFDVDSKQVKQKYEEELNKWSKTIIPNKKTPQKQQEIVLEEITHKINELGKNARLNLSNLDFGKDEIDLYCVLFVLEQNKKIKIYDVDLEKLDIEIGLPVIHKQTNNHTMKLSIEIQQLFIIRYILYKFKLFQDYNKPVNISLKELDLLSSSQQINKFVIDLQWHIVLKFEILLDEGSNLANSSQEKYNKLLKRNLLYPQIKTTGHYFEDFSDEEMSLDLCFGIKNIDEVKEKFETYLHKYCTDLNTGWRGLESTIHIKSLEFHYDFLKAYINLPESNGYDSFTLDMQNFILQLYFEGIDLITFLIYLECKNDLIIEQIYFKGDVHYIVFKVKNLDKWKKSGTGAIESKNKKVSLNINKGQKDKKNNSSKDQGNSETNREIEINFTNGEILVKGALITEFTIASNEHYFLECLWENVDKSISHDAILDYVKQKMQKQQIQQTAQAFCHLCKSNLTKEKKVLKKYIKSKRIEINDKSKSKKYKNGYILCSKVLN